MEDKILGYVAPDGYLMFGKDESNLTPIYASGDTLVGYMVMAANDPSQRGLLYYHEKAANAFRDEFQLLVDTQWDNPNKFNKEHWKEKPVDIQVHKLYTRN